MCVFHVPSEDVKEPDWTYVLDSNEMFTKAMNVLQGDSSDRQKMEREALQLFDAVAACGQICLVVEVATMLRDGKAGLKRDSKKAFQLLQKASSQKLPLKMKRM